MEPTKLSDAYFILQSLGATERKRVKQYCVAFASSAKRQTSKTRKLLTQLTEREVVPNPAVFRKNAFPSSTSNNYQWIQQNAMDTLLDYLSTDKHLNAKNEGGVMLPDSFRAKMLAHKRLMQFELAATYSARSTAFKLLYEAIELANKYQHYYQLRQGLHHLLSVAASAGDTKLLEETKHKLQRTAAQITAMEAGHEAYYTFSEATFRKGRQIAEPINELKKKLPSIAEQYEQFGGDKLGFYYLDLLGSFHSSQGEYILAQNAFSKLLALVESSEAIGSSRKVADVLICLAFELMQGYDFTLAAEHLNRAQDLFQKQRGRSAFISALELSAINYCYLNKPVKALQSINTALDWLDEQENSKLVARMNYIKAHVRFCMGDYSIAWHLLNEVRELEQERDGYNIGIRLIQFMISADSGKLQQAERGIEALRSHITRLKKAGQTIGERDRLIFNVLKAIERNDWDFAAVAKVEQESLDLLSKVTVETGWHPNTHELTPFHIWFECKAAGKPYRFALWEEAVSWQREAVKSASLAG